MCWILIISFISISLIIIIMGFTMGVISYAQQQGYTTINLCDAGEANSTCLCISGTYMNLYLSNGIVYTNTSLTTTFAGNDLYYYQTDNASSIRIDNSGVITDTVGC